MLLQEILALHQKFKPKHALSGNLGDGFLLTHNPIYKNVRKALLRAGFKLSSKRFHDYEALSLTQLPKILSEKIIPYVDNVKPLQEIEKLAPQAFGLNEVPPLKANYILHEGAHAVAYSLRPKTLKLKLKPKTTSVQKQIIILNALLEESFSNTAECLANLDSNTEIHDEFFV